MQLIYKENLTVTPDMADRRGWLLPSMLLRLSQNIAGRHCDILGITTDMLEKKGLFWAIVRNRIEIRQMPRVGQAVTLQTWPMPTTRVSFPRGTAAYDENGNLLFSCHSLWVLMDRETRAMVLPGKSGVEVPGIMLEDTPPAPTAVPAANCSDAFRWQVTAEDLDQNGHMNNARYLDWVDHALGAAFLESHRLKCATLCYINEAKEGQILCGCTKTDGENCLYFDLLRQHDDAKADRIFSAALEYDSVVM